MKTTKRPQLSEAEIRRVLGIKTQKKRLALLYVGLTSTINIVSIEPNRPVGTRNPIEQLAHGEQQQIQPFQSLVVQLGEHPASGWDHA